MYSELKDLPSIIYGYTFHVVNRDARYIKYNMPPLVLIALGTQL